MVILSILVWRKAVGCEFGLLQGWTIEEVSSRSGVVSTLRTYTPLCLN